MVLLSVTDRQVFQPPRWRYCIKVTEQADKNSRILISFNRTRRFGHSGNLRKQNKTGMKQSREISVPFEILPGISGFIGRI